MNRRWLAFVPPCCLVLLATCGALGQPLGEPDRGAPGDAMIQEYLRREAARLDAQFDDDRREEQWTEKRPEYLKQYLHMLGLAPLPEKTPLQATITGTLERDGYVVDMLHYQSRPHLYATANLYRPAKADAGAKLPAVLYVCGHSGRGRNGNKVAYQSHGIWFARHGYVCLVVDTLQLGEIAAYHHGTYNLGRWWWHSRGFTPAGVEAWNGVRGIDYLVSRDDVDPERIAVTGISGGGAATFWIAAADDRIKVAVPVSGMADLESYVSNRVINGHCDCMFLYNTYRWPWTRIAGLIAPRPMLFVNSDQDPIFPMDANERIINRLERLYSLAGASADVDAVVSVGGHAYRGDIRRAAYQFINAHLKNDRTPVTDSEVDLVSEGANPGQYPITIERLRVFPTDADLPADQQNTVIDERFVPIATPPRPAPGQFAEWRTKLLNDLREVSFGYFPAEIPAAELRPSTDAANRDDNVETIVAEPPLEYRLRFLGADGPEPKRELLLVIANKDESGGTPRWLERVRRPDQRIVICETRGVGMSDWTTKNPPNYVERSHLLLGRTVDTGRVWDIVAAARYLKVHPTRASERGLPIHIIGRGSAGILGAYAGLFSSEIESVTLVAPPATHMSGDAPSFLNILRVCDIPDAIGLLAPRRLTLIDAEPSPFETTAATYRAADAADKFVPN